MRRARTGRPPLPLGPGLVARYVRSDDATLHALGAALAGYDNLGSVHGDGNEVVILTTESLAPTLDAVLAGLRDAGLRFELSATAPSTPPSPSHP